MTTTEHLKAIVRRLKRSLEQHSVTRQDAIKQLAEAERVIAALEPEDSHPLE